MELIIFDLDGVIVSTDRHHYDAWKALADKHNLLFNYEINSLLRGVSRSESLNIILDVNSRAVEPHIFATMLEEKNDLYRGKLKHLTEKDILPGVPELLEDLKKNGILVAIGSSSRNAPAILEGIGLRESFDIIVDGNGISKSKPDPEVFLKCASGLEIDPDKCLVYEDAQAGIDAALAAGMTAVGVGAEPLKGAHWKVASLEQESYGKILENHRQRSFK